MASYVALDNDLAKVTVENVRQQSRSCAYIEGEIVRNFRHKFAELDEVGAFTILLETSTSRVLEYFFNNLRYHHYDIFTGG